MSPSCMLVPFFYTLLSGTRRDESFSKYARTRRYYTANSGSRVGSRLLLLLSTRFCRSNQLFSVRIISFRGTQTLYSMEVFILAHPLFRRKKKYGRYYREKTRPGAATFL